MAKLSEIVYGTANGSANYRDPRKFNFDELVPTQDTVFRHRLWRAQRKYRDGAGIPNIKVIPTYGISQAINHNFPEYPILKNKVYIWDGHARALVAKKQVRDGIIGEWVTEKELSEDDMFGTALDQKIFFLYMTFGMLKSLDDIHTEKRFFGIDFVLSLKPHNSAFLSP